MSLEQWKRKLSSQDQPSTRALQQPTQILIGQDAQTKEDQPQAFSSRSTGHRCHGPPKGKQ